MLRRTLLAIAVAMVAFAPAAPAQDKRVALVIGNNAYERAFALRNAVGDADAMTAALTRLGFAVTTLKDAGKAGMRGALTAFSEKTKMAEVALLFFAGHSIEVAGVSWLVPVDGSADTLSEVTGQSISLEQVLAAMRGASKAAIVLLDAGRDNPFAKPGERVAGGLRETKPQDNVFIAFSTGVGSQTYDGLGANSPFTGALLRNIETAGLSLVELMKRVQADVAHATSGRQRPAYYDQLPDDNFTLMPR